MKVNKTSQEVADYNARNAAPIEAGLMEAWEQSPEAAAEEKKRADYKAEAERLAQRKVAVLKAVYDALPEDVRALYVEPNANPGDFRFDMVAKTYKRAPYVELDPTYSGGFRPVLTGYRLKVDGQGWVKLETEEVTPEKVAKVVAKVLLGEERGRSRFEAQQAANSANQRKLDFIAANPDLCRRISFDAYTERATVGEDGRLSFGGVTATAAQWAQIADLCGYGRWTC